MPHGEGRGAVCAFVRWAGCQPPLWRTALRVVLREALPPWRGRQPLRASQLDCNSPKLLWQVPLLTPLTHALAFSRTVSDAALLLQPALAAFSPPQLFCHFLTPSHTLSPPVRLQCPIRSALSLPAGRSRSIDTTTETSSSFEKTTTIKKDTCSQPERTGPTPKPELSVSNWDSSSTIFVAVASYRDEICHETIGSLFKNAAFPDRVVVGLVQQVAQSFIHTGRLCHSLATCATHRLHVSSVQA